MTAMSGKFKALAGFSSNNFDIPYILVRLLANGIFEIPSLLDESTAKPWEKVNIDIKEIARLGRYSSPSLLGLCTVLGVPSPKEEISGKDVSKAFFDGRIEEIKDYCERDVAATANCLLRLQGKELLEMESVVMEKSFREEGYRSELDRLLDTGEADLFALTKEGIRLSDRKSVV